MNKNIFIKNKNSDISNKFNPDVIKKYSDLNQTRNSSKYEFLNKPYKMIIKDKVIDKVHSQADLKIDLSENNININQNYDKIVNDRKYLDNINNELYNKSNYEQNKSKLDFRKYEVNKMSKESDDFNNLKKSNKTFYNKQNEELLQEKSKYNDIMNNLKKQGII